MHKSAKSQNTFFPRKSQKRIFSPKPKITRQNHKNAFFHKKTHFPAKLKKKNTFSRQNRKNAFSCQNAFSYQYHKRIFVKSEKSIFPQNRKNIFSRQNRKTHFSAKTAKFIFPTKPKIIFFIKIRNQISRQNHEYVFSAKTTKLYFLPNHILKHLYFRQLIKISIVKQKNMIKSKKYILVICLLNSSRWKWR